MSEQNLNALLPILNAISAAEVRRPKIPMSVSHQEAHDLMTFCAKDDVRTRLLKVGLAEENIDNLSVALGASRYAQSSWMVIRDQAKPDAQKKREEEGYAMRADILPPCRWNLRDSRTAMGALRLIADGQGVADLIQDLSDLAALIRANLAAFDSDTTFDASAVAEAALALSKQIEIGLSDTRVDSTQQDAIDQRDRAWTHLDTLIGEIRAAGRYAFYKEPETADVFASAYLRRRRAALLRRGSNVSGEPADA